jgi:hypothetical protein
VSGAPTLLGAILFLAILVIGVLVFVVGTLMIRISNLQAQEPTRKRAPVAWTRAFLDSDDEVDVPTRLEMVNQLVFIREQWSVSILRIAQAEENAPDVLAAIAEALVAKQ